MIDNSGTISPAALQQLRATGFRVVFSAFGPAGTGKTTRALAELNRFRVAGHAAYVNDEIWREGKAGVEIWAKRR